MRLLNPSERVRELLNTTKLDTVFEITEERSDSTVYGCASSGLGYGV